MSRVSYIECDTCHRRAYSDDEIWRMGLHFRGGLDQHECEECARKEFRKGHGRGNQASVHFGEAGMSEQAKHTPGPWVGDRLDGTIKYVARGAGDKSVLVINDKTGDYGFTCPQDADCEPDCYSRHMADERLFLAAPDLLAALRRYVDVYGSSVNTADLRAEALAAIAKAEPV